LLEHSTLYYFKNIHVDSLLFFYLAASVFGFGLKASNILHVDLSGIKCFFFFNDSYLDFL